MANIYSGHSSKNKSDLVEMVVYRCITNNISKLDVQDISTKELTRLLGVYKIKVKSLPGYSNKGLRKKEIKPYTSEPSIKIVEWY